MRGHLLVGLALVAVALGFYAPVLDNGFWHGEDFRALQAAQQLHAEPGLLLQRDALARHHPVPLALFLAEYELFGHDATGWYVVNLLLHGANAFLVYLLVMVLLADRRIAVLSGVLFAVGVGSYGKAVMFAGGAENLLITTLYLLILVLYIRDDLHGERALLRPRFLLILLLFLLVSLAKPTSFALVGGLLAYKVFFRGERGSSRRIAEPRLLLLVGGAVVFWAVREFTGTVTFSHGSAGDNPLEFAVNFVKNMLNYLVHMFFPVHVSRLVETSNPLVRALYAMAPVLRFVIGLSLISYSLFGFVFGNRTIRFFLSWTFISVLPYCAVAFPADWLNIRYLYQVSIGFCFIMASGTVLSMDLLHRRRWRRFLPYAVPLLFVLVSGYITARLDAKYESESASPAAQLRLEQLRAADPGPGR